MAEQYDVTEGQCPEDCPDVEVATYCINELQQVQNISRVNVKKSCPEGCPCDGEYNSEGCTLCGKCDGHPGFDLPKTFCVSDTQPAQNVMRLNVNKDGESLWEIGEGDILQPKEDRTFTIKKANEVDVAEGSADKYLNEQGDFTKPINAHKDVTEKNAETDFQHIDTTITKGTLVEADKVAILDSVTGKVVLTDKTNVGVQSTKDILYADLLALINNNELIPDSSYRITNYTTTTVQADTTSAGHDFDIIVTALSANKLSEVASCVRKAGDTYFANANLESWEIKYCIHNDTSRFAWADTVNGKGVIYYMKDEWNNECPYDFKNIQFKKSNVFLYTFGGTADDSLIGGCHHNIIIEYTLNSVLILNFNTFGINCSINTFGTSCYSNTFGNNCQNNKFGIYCQINTFGNSCVSNTFGDNCNNNTFGNNCYYNTFGDSCKSNNFYTGTSGATKKDYLRYIVLEDGCANNNFYSTLTTSSTSFLQRIRIKGLEFTAATNTQITLLETNTKYEWVICYTSDGILKQYYSGDSLINNYDAETVPAPANSGTLTLKNATETVISTTLTNSNSFTIALPTAVAGKINESILIFKVGATLPTLTQPAGVIYRTETPVIAINQTWTFCYERVSYDSGSNYEIYVSATKNV